MAYGDPRYIGYLASNRYNRGFPEYVRAFNSAFLALPAVPSELWTDASSVPEVIVRAYPTDDYGTYLAVVNTALDPVDGVTITVPVDSRVTDAVTGNEILAMGSSIDMNLYPGEVRALVVKEAQSTPLADGGMPSMDDGGMMPISDEGVAPVADGGMTPVEGRDLMVDRDDDTPDADPSMPDDSRMSSGNGDSGCQTSGDRFSIVTLFGLAIFVGLRRRWALLLQ